MKLCGMNSHWRFYELEECFKNLNFMGYKHIELWTGPMHFYVDYLNNENINKIKKLSKKFNIEIVAICPEQTNPKPNNIASKFRKNEVFKYYKRVIDIAKYLNTKYVTVTSGWAYLNEDRETAYKRSISMMKKVASYALKKEITLVLEALQYDESILVNTSKQIYQYILDVDVASLKVCIDFGAMARANETIDDYFENCPNLIKHIHFVDGNPTGHLAYSDGNRNIVYDLKSLIKNKYDGFLSCESVSSKYFIKPWEADLKNISSFKKGMEVIN